MNSLKIIQPFLKENKLLLIIYSLCIIISHPLESIIIPKIFSNFFEELNNNISNEIFIKYFKILASFMTLITIAYIINSKLDASIITNFYESVSNIFFEKILYFYENNYSDLELGKLGARLSVVPSIIKELTTDLFNWVIPKFLTILFINIYFFRTNTKLGCLSLIVVSSIFFFNILSFNPCIDLSYDRYILYENKSEQIQDKLSNLSTIYSSGNTNFEINEYKKIISTFKNKQYNTLICINNIKNFNNIFILILFLLLCVFTVYLYKNKEISNKELITIFMILLFYTQGLNTIATYLPDYVSHLGVIKSVNSFINEIYINQSVKPDIVLNSGKIEIKNLNFGYNKTNIFNNFNLTINNNEKIGIIGNSGNGKSTIIKLIMGYYKVKDNTIFIDNKDINKYNLKSLRKQISYINQNTKLFNKSIYENIQYGNNISINEIKKLFEKFNLNKLFNNIDKNKVVGVNGDELSGGQKQIIQLLRIYNKNNKILILDEPTASLDNDTKIIIINIIKEISKNNTLLIITHDNSNLNIIDRIIKIQNGKIFN